MNQAEQASLPNPALVAHQRDRWKRSAFKVLLVFHHVLACAPLATIAAVYASSWHIQANIGHWPIANLDDPKYSLREDWLAYILNDFVSLLFLTSFVALLLFPAITVVLWRLRRSYHPLWLLLLFVAFLAGLTLMRVDPGGRLYWWFD